MKNININKIKRSRLIKEFDSIIRVELNKLDSLTDKRYTRLYFESVELCASYADKCRSWGGLVGLIDHTYKMLDSYNEMVEASKKYDSSVNTGRLTMNLHEDIVIELGTDEAHDITVFRLIDWAESKVESFGSGSRYSKAQDYVRLVELYSQIVIKLEGAVNNARKEMERIDTRIADLASFKEDTKMEEVKTVKETVKTVAEEIDELLSNSETVVNKEDTEMRENDNSVTEIVTEYETDNVNDVEVAAICEDGTVEVLRPIIKKNKEACEFSSKSKAPDIVKNESNVVVTADDLRAEMRQLQDLEEHEVSDVLAHKIIEARLDILITQEGGVYKAQCLSKGAWSGLIKMFGCFQLEHKAMSRLSMERQYFDMVAANTTPTQGSKHRAKLLDYLSTCTMDTDGWICDHLGRRWINPLTGSLAEGITAGDNYSKGGRWFTVLPNGEACSFPDYWVSIGWLALFYKTRLSWDGLVYWFTSGTTEVNHKNGNRLECALDNIELVHSWDNSRHAAFMRMFKGCGFFNSRWVEYSMKDGRAGAGHWEMDFGVSAQLVGLEFNRCRTYTKAPKLNKEKAWDSWALCGHHELNNVKNDIWQEAEEAYYKREGITC